MKPLHFRNKDINTLIHSVVHAHHPGITDKINVHCQGMTQTNTSVENHHIDLCKDPIFNSTVSYVQPSQNLAPRVLPTLPYSKENLLFLKKVQFQYSDLKDSEYT